jgi:hypothetical protein
VSPTAIPVRFTPTRDDAVLSMWESIGRRWTLLAAPLVVVAMVLLVAWTRSRGRAWGEALLQTLPIALLMAAFALYVFLYLPRKAFERLPPERRAGFCELVCTEKGIEGNYGSSPVAADWSLWRWFVETPGYFILYPPDPKAPEGPVALPKRGFSSPEDLRDFRSLLARKLTPWRARG